MNATPCPTETDTVGWGGGGTPLKLSYISMTAESSACDFVRLPEDVPNLCLFFADRRLPLDITGTLRIAYSKLTHNTRYAKLT